MPHLLLYGPPGSGKTSTALALISTMYKGGINKTNVLEVKRIKNKNEKVECIR